MWSDTCPLSCRPRRLFISISLESKQLGNTLSQESGALAIDLKNVSLIDGDAVQLLALAESNGTELRALSEVYPRMGQPREVSKTRGELSNTRWATKAVHLIRSKGGE
jgi:hypothetical protein